MEFKYRWNIYKSTMFWGWWKVVVLIFSLAGVYDLLQGSFPSLRLPVLEQIADWLDWRIWIILALFFAVIGTAEGSFRYIRKIKNDFVNNIQEKQRLERKEQRLKYRDASIVTKRLSTLYATIERIADESCKTEAMPLDQMAKVADRLTQARVFEEMGGEFVKFSIAPTYGELEKLIRESDHRLVAQTMRRMLFLLKNAMTEMGYGLGSKLHADADYSTLYNDIQRTIAGLPNSITMKVNEYIETAESINNLR